MGTRAMTFIEPYNIWIITQFDGYPNGLGRTLRQLIKMKACENNLVFLLNKKHKIRTKGKTEIEALKIFLGNNLTLEELERKRDIFIEYIWKIDKDWKLKRLKFEKLKQVKQ